MIQTDGSHLTGLEGTNPLGYFAALGVQVVFSDDPALPRLWWSDDITPHAIVDGGFDADRIADRAMKVFADWGEAGAMNPAREDGTAMEKGDSLKLSPDDLREYLRQHRLRRAAGLFPSSAVAEGSIDNSGQAKPSDLYFTAGQQKFLREARKILSGVTREDVVGGLAGPWTYRSKLPSMGWDVVDDRIYALRADDPSKEKLTNPGPEALAILGMSLYPVFAGHGRTLTQGCYGSWARGYFSWPLWGLPMSLSSVRTVLAQVGRRRHRRGGQTDERGRVPQHADQDDMEWLRALSVRQILTSGIRRSSQGGYGTFGPPEIAWIDPSESGIGDLA